MGKRPTTIITDYRGYYNKLWKEAVIETPFYKTANEWYNDVYIGVTRQAAKQHKNMIVWRLTSLMVVF